MAIGDPGANGFLALSHVAQEQHIAFGAVAVLPLHVAETVAQDQAHTYNTHSVTHNVAEV